MASHWHAAVRCAFALLACGAAAAAREPAPPALLPTPVPGGNAPLLILAPPAPEPAFNDGRTQQSVSPRRSAQITPPLAPPAAEPVTAPPAPEFSLDQVNAGQDIRPLRDTSIQLTPTFARPENTAANVYTGAVNLRQTTGWIARMDSYHAAYTPYHPLYFEETNLERYGYNCGCAQPLISAVKFYGTLPLLPYKMTVRSPCSYESNLDLPPAATAAPPVPCRIELPDPKAVSVEAGVVAGLILLIP